MDNLVSKLCPPRNCCSLEREIRRSGFYCIRYATLLTADWSSFVL